MNDHAITDGTDFRARAEAVVASLTLEQRIGLISGRDFWNTKGIDGLVDSFMVSDGPHGLRKQAGDADHVGLSNSVPATCFPVAANLAATWDPALLTEIGVALGTEARAQDVAILLGPGMNIKRHPRGGRNFEYLSEDPLLSGKMAAALVRGIQSTGVGACPKHFAANNQETRRMVIDTIVDERTLRELYLRGFEIVVDEAAPASMMTSYNQINGEFASENSVVLGQILRGEWGYDGLVMSDWGGTNDHVAGLRHGMDLEMPGGADPFAADISKAIANGSLAESDLNRSAARVVERALRWSALKAGSSTPAPDFDAHHTLARRAAAESAILLQNNGILPLGAAPEVALIGAFAEHPRYQGAGSSKVNPTRMDNLRDALQEASHTPLAYAPGYDHITGASSAELIADAVRVAQSAPAVVLVIGLPARLETEAKDRENTDIPSGMNALVTAVVAANPRTVVVLMNGGSVAMPWANDVAAILEAGLTGQAGGGAIADVLLGIVEPGGRLAESVPVAMHELASNENFPGTPTQVEYREGLNVGYRFHETHGVPALFPFGHGLGYTSFEFANAQVVGRGTEYSVTLTVTNSGDRAGSTVVQVYAAPPASTVYRPAKALAGFAKVRLDAGASAAVHVSVDPKSFSVWDVAAQAWVTDPGDYRLLLGSSVTNICADLHVFIHGDNKPTPAVIPTSAVASAAEFTELLGHAIPTPKPLRPFTRTSTVTDLAATRLGRLLGAGMRKGMEKQISPEERAEAGDLIDAVMEGLPLRGIGLMSGALSLSRLDRLIAVLNGDLRTALRKGR